MYPLVGRYWSRWALRPFGVELDEEKTRAEVVELLLVGSVRESMLKFGLSYHTYHINVSTYHHIVRQLVPLISFHFLFLFYI